MRNEFYPNMPKSELFNGYIARESNHSRGSTADLTIVPYPIEKEPEYTPGEKLKPCTGDSKADRWPDNGLDMGTGFDCLDVKSHTMFPNITK